MATILIIDDDKLMREMLGSLFTRSGYNVFEAKDGNIGMELFRQHQPDLVITDIVMPEKEGLETIMDLRDYSPDVKIIAISGGGRAKPDDYLPLAKKLGAIKVFAKPIEPKILLKAVKELLSDK